MKKQWYKSLRYLSVIFALEGGNSYFSIEQWIPMVELILGVWIVASQFYVVLLVTKIIKEINPRLKERYSKYWAMGYISLIGLLFSASFIMVNLMFLFIFIFSPHFVREATFENRAFYIYDSSGFRDTMMDVCTPSHNFLTRTRLMTIDNDYNLSLYQQGYKVILKTSTQGDIEVYDLNTSEDLYGGE